MYCRHPAAPITIAPAPWTCSVTAMRNPLNLRSLLALAISLLTCALIALVMLTIGRAGVQRAEADVGDSVRLLADQMQDKFDRTLFERYREIGTAARLFRTLAVADRPEGAQAWLVELQKTYPDYAWIGFANRDGKVRRATDGLLEGADVSNRPWFQAGLKEVSVGDVHEDEVLAKLLTHRTTEATPRFLDISAPVLGHDGEVIGVLGAQLDWSWAEDVRDSLFGDTPAGKSEQVLVLTSSGVVLLGPQELTGKTLELDSVRKATAHTSRFAIETWPDGNRYVTGYARSDGYRNFAGLGWIVMVRRDANVALAPVRNLQQQGLLWSLALAGLASLGAWLLAGRIAAPLLHLANASDAVRDDEETAIPNLRDYAEIQRLSASLSTLVTELKRRQADLRELNRSLEGQVAQRTSELTARNFALTLARVEAEAATAAKSRFLAVASHDLRQPLHAITLFASALSRRVSGNEAPRLVAQLESSLASLKGMFDSLLNVSRLDAGLIEPNITSVSARAIVEGIAGGFRAEAEGRGLRFRSHAVDATISTDPVLLETMLRNLVSNALKFTSKGGVLLAARRRGGQVLFEVYDTGPGISSEQHAHIYEEFERSKEHATGANDGLGLGLSIVRRYANLLGFQIKLFSRVGRGTRFSLVCSESTATPIEVSRVDASVATAFEHSTLVGTRILIIDDDPQIIAGMELELTDRGCKVLYFPTVQKANDALIAGLKFDAAIVDYDLGNGQTGPALLDVAERSRGLSIPALILTGGTDAATLTTVIKTKRPWLTKPAEPDAVANALAALIAAASDT